MDLISGLGVKYVVAEKMLRYSRKILGYSTSRDLTRLYGNVLFFLRDIGS